MNQEELLSRIEDLRNEIINLTKEVDDFAERHKDLLEHLGYAALDLKIDIVNPPP